VRRWLRACFALAAVSVFVLALWPTSEPMPLHTGWDKADHASAFVVLGLLGLLGWPSAPVRLSVGLLGYGALIEVLQAFSVYRQADWRDWVADAVGVGIAVLVLSGWRKRLRGRAHADEA
jgi:VanZ family protein